VAQLGLFGAPPPEVAPADVDAELVAIAARLPAELRMGTSTWSFPGWRGIVYAGEHTGEVLARAGLTAYAAHPLLRSVGVDRTHYGPVGPDVFAGWAASVPADFRFLVKAHELCTLAVVPTHARYGAKRGLENPLFFDAAYARDVVVGPYVEGLADRAGVLVFQLAQQPIGALGGSPRRFAERLYRFLRDLPKGPRYAVEIRNSALLTADYAAALRHGGAVHCFTVVPAMPAPDVQRTVVGSQPALVVRWNQTALYDYEGARAAYKPFDRIVDPDPASRRAIATLIEEAERLHLPSWLIVNNKAEGSAPLSIERLAREVAGRLAGAPSAAE
jgi:uncharacterized protein YecE (DUF72 family)